MSLFQKTAIALARSPGAGRAMRALATRSSLARPGGGGAGLAAGGGAPPPPRAGGGPPAARPPPRGARPPAILAANLYEHWLGASLLAKIMRSR
ncbi:hypothetical protein PVA98_21915, partial [Achromobacter xylosoxidans]|nr:hypothetical protein [Achromobacter xylosoxidans]